MRIRKLDLQGFKSFVDRQTFHFGSGIAGVVGPNGCGKSNVVDAVRWCIGEQSAKSLRGAAMQDVIFNGSASRSPVGMAEVCMTFASDEEPFPGRWARYEELSITRRLFRDGASEYRINQERVRLRDIHDLFLDTGVGARLYSFIEQGQVDRIVLSRPEERRVLVEEAAGISRYKARRAEALDKLDRTRVNLERVSEIADDMKRRMRSLERQVEKAARYRCLRATVRQGELLLGLGRFAGLTADRRALVGDLRQARVAENAAIRTLAAKEEGLTGLRDLIGVAEALVADLRDGFAEHEAQRRESESARHYLSRESTDLEGRLEQLERALVEWDGQHKKAGTETQKLEDDLTRLEETLSGQATAAERAATRAREAQEHLSIARAAVEQDKQEITALLTEASQTRANLSVNVRAAQELAERRARAEVGDSASRTGLTALREVLAGAEAGLALADQAVTDAAAARTDALRRHAQARILSQESEAHLREFEQARTQAERNLTRVETRKQSLQDLFDAHDGVGDGARELMEVPGVLGTLAEHLDGLEAEPGLLHAAVGDALEHVLVEDQKALLDAAAAARGRVGLVSVQAGPEPEPEALAARFEGTPAGRAAVARLLSGFEQSSSLEEALRAHAVSGQPVVAGDGTRIDASGVVWAGTPGRSGGLAILERRRELAELAGLVQEGLEQVKEAGGRLAVAEQALTKARATEADLLETSEELETAWRDAQLVQVEARQRLHLKAQELRQQEGQVREREVERERLEASEARLVTEAAQARIELSELEQRQTEAEAQLHQRQANLESLEDQTNGAREELATLKGERDGGLRQVEVLSESLAASRSRLAEAERQLDRTQVEMRSSQTRVVEVAVEDKNLGERIAFLGEEQGKVAIQLKAEREGLKQNHDRLRAAEEGLRGLRDQREKCTVTRTRLEHNLQEVRLQIDGIKEQVEGRHGVSLPGMLDRLDRDAALVLEAMEGPHRELPEAFQNLPIAEDLRVTPALLENREELQAWIDRLEGAREQLRRLGEVNLVALDEYLEVEERWSWLEGQRSDLERSMESIRRAIADINRTCRVRFRDTYDRVDKAFQQLYPRLVGGGEARLALTDEDDLLETGVEIYACPPGKRLQSLRLLSGGEKAMTAIALIFAIFMVKPSPFCILDEVDAPLDEGNGARFNALLREMSMLSQFILITHNKKTMESVDTLYGVTMPDPGISRLVSVRIA